jgi:hypothetical protein
MSRKKAKDAQRFRHAMHLPVESDSADALCGKSDSARSDSHIEFSGRNRTPHRNKDEDVSLLRASAVASRVLRLHFENPVESIRIRSRAWSRDQGMSEIITENSCSRFAEMARGRGRVRFPHCILRNQSDLISKSCRVRFPQCAFKEISDSRIQKSVVRIQNGSTVSKSVFFLSVYLEKTDFSQEIAPLLH